MCKASQPRPLLSVVIVFFATLALLGGCSTSSQHETEPRRQIAITFDDAPRGDGQVFSGAERTARLIAELDKHDVGPVAVFVRTDGMDRESGRARIVAYDRAGHRIANHSHTHRAASRQTAEEFLADVDLAQEALAPLANTRSWFRYPFLDEGGQLRHATDGEPDLLKRDAIRRGLAARGLQNGYVTVDTFDWYLDRILQQAVSAGAQVDEKRLAALYADMVTDAADHFELAAQSIGQANMVHVLLLHENDLAAAFIGDAITALRTEGWDVVDPDLAFNRTLPLPITGESGDGRLVALAVDRDGNAASWGETWSNRRDGIDRRAKGIFTKNDSEGG